MAAAYHAPLSLACASAALMATDPFPFVSSHSDRHHLLSPSFSSSRGVEACGVRTSIATVEKRTRDGRRARRANWRKISCAFSDSPEVITSSSWKESVLQSKVPVLVEFWASWCGPCRMTHRVIEEVAQEYAGRIHCFKLNTDDHPHIAASHDIERVPTIMLFKNGERLQSFTGTMPKSVYVAAIEKSLSR